MKRASTPPQASPERVQSDPNLQSKNGSRLSCVHWHNLSRARRLYWRLRWFSEKRLSHLVYILDVLVRQLRSFCYRTVLESRKRYDLYGGAGGPYYQVDSAGHLSLNIRTHDGMRDRETFASQTRWATMLDLDTYWEAWQQGATWALDNSCKRGTESRESSQHLSKPSASPESTRCDRSDQPPSPESRGESGERERNCTTQCKRQRQPEDETAS